MERNDLLLKKKNPLTHYCRFYNYSIAVALESDRFDSKSLFLLWPWGIRSLGRFFQFLMPLCSCLWIGMLTLPEESLQAVEMRGCFEKQLVWKGPSKPVGNISVGWHCRSQGSISWSLLVLCLFSFFGLVFPSLIFSTSIQFHTDSRVLSMTPSHLFWTHSMLFITRLKPIFLNSFPETTLRCSQTLYFKSPLLLPRLFCEHGTSCTSTVLPGSFYPPLPASPFFFLPNQLQCSETVYWGVLWVVVGNVRLPCLNLFPEDRSSHGKYSGLGNLEIFWWESTVWYISQKLWKSILKFNLEIAKYYQRC